jgi:GNAT superfamily N-acetyltransferase
MDIVFRVAHKEDIPGIQVVRNAVKENMLSNPALVSDADCEEFIIRRGKGWVATSDEKIVGFSIADLADRNIWALFVEPGYDKKGIGRELHRLMLDWYFGQTSEPVWLGTAPNTRAEKFYRDAGWKEIGIHGKGEIKFQMRKEDWQMRGR